MLVVLKYRPNSIFANIQPVIKPVWQLVGCLYTRYNRLSCYQWCYLHWQLRDEAAFLNTVSFEAHAVYYLTLCSLLSVLRTGKPNWRGVQLFRRTNRKMANVLIAVTRFHSVTFVRLCDARFYESFDSHLEDNCNKTCLIFSIFFFLSLNTLHIKKINLLF